MISGGRAPFAGAALDRFAIALRRWQLSISLVTDRRAVTLAVIDGLFVFFAVIIALLGEGTVTGIYYSMFLVPALLFGVPTLSEVVALERRAGTLDLALSSPGAGTYFERRVLALSIIIFMQGLVAIFAARLAIEWFPLSGALVQTLVVTLFVCSVTLFWSVRLRTSGSVIFAAYITILCFSPWFVTSAYHPLSHHNGPMETMEIVAWFKRNLVLASASAILYLYTLQRLSRPQAILD